MEVLSKVPPEAWIGLAGVAIGSALSILGTWLTNRASLERLNTQLRHERESANRDLHRAKLEELYTLVGAWLNSMAGYYLSLSMVMQGKISYNDHLDVSTKGNIGKSYDFNRMEMIVDVYGHDVKCEYKKVMKLRGELNSLANDFKKSYENGNLEGEKYLNPFVNLQIQIERATKELQARIATCAINA